jgi:primosomal protein N' (replication factor Y)
VTITDNKHTQPIQAKKIESTQTVEVAIPLPLDGTFHYAVPAKLLSLVRPGLRVFVPFGRRKMTAYILEFSNPPEDQQLKELLEVLDEEPLWTEAELTFFRWIADYYLHPLGEVLKTALPAGINLQSRQNNGAENIIGGKKIRKERIFAATESTEPAKIKGKGLDILEFLRQTGPTASAELRQRFGECNPNLKRLIQLELARMSEREIYRDPFAGLTVVPDSSKALMQHQGQALATILQACDSGSFSPFLLHGITGSGKTEVYLQAIAHALAKGQNALVLVPEISLTPQLVQRFRARFRDGIAVLHSALSDGERYDEWRRIRRGEVRIVIGARSAIFAPLQRIGIIVVDEEHETSFKQSEGLRYNARDLALVRGQQGKAVVLLGSATPLVTTRFAAQQGKLGYLSLPVRVGSRSLPETSIITTRMTAEAPLSSVLIQALTENLERREQSLLFLNRRGFASWMACTACGADLQCPNCSVSLTYHRQRRKSICHYCDYQVPSPCICPTCGELEMKEMGVGTERVEHELYQLFPDARIARMDSDTTSGKGGHARILDKVGRGEVDILVGTQMIAKGHDFPGVTLVGVLQAEGSLYLPDFRATERTFQVLSQVIGRAGRGDLPGRVLIQAMNPDHYALTAAASHNFEGFYEEERAFRQELNYPPYGFLVAIKLSATSESALLTAADSSARLLGALKNKLGLRTEILGPAPAPLYRLRGRFRRQILLKDTSRAALRRLLAAYRREQSHPGVVRESIDIDPVDLL